MKTPIFFKIVTISLFFALLSLVLFVASFVVSGGFSIAYFVYVLIIILGISFFAAGSITEPLKKLREGFENLMKENFVSVEVKTGNEFEEIANSFNHMAKELVNRREMLKKSEEKYRSLIEDINDWVFELNKNLVFTYSSPRAKEIIDYSPEEIIGRNIYEFIPNKYHKLIKLEFERIMRNKSAFSNLECVFINKNGEKVVLEICGRPFFNENGEIKRFRVVGRDITERKKNEEKLAYLAAITKHSADAIIALDSKGNIVSWNRGAEMMFGYESEEIIGMPFHILVPPESRSKYKEVLKVALDEGYVKDLETKRVTKGGRVIYVEQTLTSMFNKEGGHIGFALIMRDITHRKRAEEKLKEAYRTLENKSRELLKSKRELEYLANIIENSNDAIYSMNLQGIITSWNKTAENIFGWKKEEILGKHANFLLPDDLSGETDFIIEKILDGSKYLSFETRRLTKDKTLIYVDITIFPILGDEGKPSGVSIIARDVTSKKKAEDEMLRRILKYEVERGRIYLIQEENPKFSIDILLDMVKCGYSGLIITRKKQYNINKVKTLWLSNKDSKNTIKPDISEIESLIINLPERNSVILLELDYLILKQGFEKIFKFIQRIREVLYVLNKGILIFTISPDFLKDEYIKLIKMECEDIRPKRRRIPYEMYEVLRNVYKLNRVGEKPSIKELISELKIARNTCKKRIKYLENRGLIKTIKAGRTKILEITEKGKEFFY